MFVRSGPFPRRCSLAASSPSTPVSGPLASSALGDEGDQASPTRELPRVVALQAHKEPSPCGSHITVPSLVTYATAGGAAGAAGNARAGGSDLRMRPCRSTSEVSLAYVPRSRPCTVEEMRDRAEEGEW